MIHDNVIYQYNQSAIRLEKIGIQYSSKSTRHINIRYSFINDRFIKQEESLESCLNFYMIGDYSTKALQESQFRRSRNIILGIHEDDISAFSASGSALLEELKIKLNKKKEEYQEASKLAGD